MSKDNTPRSLLAGANRGLFVSTAIAMFLAALLSLMATVAEFTVGLRPVLIATADNIADTVKRDIEYMMSVGVPYEEIRGLEAYVADLIEKHPEVSAIALGGPEALDAAEIEDAMPDSGDAESEDAQGLSQRAVSAGFDFLEQMIELGDIVLGRLHGEETVSTRIVAGGETIAQVHVSINQDYVASQMTSVFFDTLVILIAVSLVAFEVVVVISASQLTEPLNRVEHALSQRAKGQFPVYQRPRDQGRFSQFIAYLNARNDQLRGKVRSLLDQSQGALKDRLQAFSTRHELSEAEPERRALIMDARIPLFVFCFAEELQKSFLPLFVAEYHTESDLFSRDIMLGLPISCFMFVIAAITPFAGRLVDTYGNRRLFLIGLVPAIGGYLWCFVAGSANDIVLARSVTAIGYAIITISCQSYIAAVLTAENRARGMAVFVGVLMTATMCGTAIGAILADWLGYKPVFLIAASFSLVAGVLGYFMLSADVKAQEKKAPGAKKRGALGILMRNTQFVLIVLFCAIPAKIILTGFLYLFVPIYLASLEATQSEIGRIMMIYSLVIIPISPLASRFADQIGRNLWVVIYATIVSGLVLLGLYQSPTVAAVIAVVAALGVAHAFIKAPLIVAAMEAAEASPDITRTGALSLLRTSERIGSVLGPVVVAALLVVYDYAAVAAMLGVAIAFVGITMAFVTLSRGRRGAAGHA